MDLKLTPSPGSQSFKEKLSKSTVFDAAIEQAQISISRIRRSRDITNISRESTCLRSSSTYESSIFQPPASVSRRQSFYKPKDSLSVSSLGSEPPDFYRKSIVSDFKPNFQPVFKNQSTWEVDPETFIKKTENFIKPVPRKEKCSDKVFKNHLNASCDYTKDCSSQGYIKSVQNKPQISSRPTTPKCRSVRNPLLCSENTGEHSARVETEPDRYYKSILRENSRTNNSFSRIIDEKDLRFSRDALKYEDRKNEENYERAVKAWRSNKVMMVCTGTGRDEKVPGYMRKTISSLCKRKKVD